MTDVHDITAEQACALAAAAAHTFPWQPLGPNDEDDGAVAILGERDCFLEIVGRTGNAAAIIPLAAAAPAMADLIAALHAKLTGGRPTDEPQISREGLEEAAKLWNRRYVEMSEIATRDAERACDQMHLLSLEVERLQEAIRVAKANIYNVEIALAAGGYTKQAAIKDLAAARKRLEAVA
jgi:hypothetical protein